MENGSDTISVVPSLAPATHTRVEVRTPPIRPQKSESDPEDIRPGITSSEKS